MLWIYYSPPKPCWTSHIYNGYVYVAKLFENSIKVHVQIKSAIGAVPGRGLEDKNSLNMYTFD